MYIFMDVTVKQVQRTMPSGGLGAGLRLGQGAGTVPGLRDGLPLLQRGGAAGAYSISRFNRAMKTPQSIVSTVPGRAPSMASEMS